jgi:hypothetical protein
LYLFFIVNLVDNKSINLLKEEIMQLDMNSMEFSKKVNNKEIPEIHSYPKVWALGHREILDIFKGPVQLEEKIDGSQFSMGIVKGEIVCRSKGQQILIDFPEKMFNLAILTAKTLELHEGWIYRGEFLAKPHHNVLAYSRIPKMNVILFDVNTGNEVYLSYEEKKAEADRLGLECVPMFFRGIVSGPEEFKELLNTQSILGGTTIEGIVVKNYDLFLEDKKVAMGKFVNEKFKEVAAKIWKTNNPKQSDIIEQIISEYNTDARKMKAIGHARDEGKLQLDPRDIPVVMKAMCTDTFEEEAVEIKEKLFAYAWPKIQRGLTAGLAGFYKNYLLEQAFGPQDNKEEAVSEEKKDID